MVPDLITRTLVVAAMFLQTVCYAADTDYVLRTNPFVRPATDIDKARAGKGEGKQLSDSMELRGTMLAGDNSQANIGGVIVGIGKDVNGYKLISVHQRYVVLDRDGIQKEISVYDKDGDGRDD